MKPTHLLLFSVLILLAACQPATGQDEPLRTEIDGNLGETYTFIQELSSTGDIPLTAEHLFHVNGLSPGSPTRSSRRLFITITCEGTGLDDFSWSVSGVPTVEEDAALGCGDSVTVYATDEHPDFEIQANLPTGVASTITYTVQIEIHAPY